MLMFVVPALVLSASSIDSEDIQQAQPTPQDNPPALNITYQPPDLSNLWSAEESPTAGNQPVIAPTLTPDPAALLAPPIVLPLSIPTPALPPAPDNAEPTLIPQDSPAENIQPMPDNTLWTSLVRATWEGYKANYIFCGANCGGNMGIVFDPSMGYQAVSEGVGYGLLMAVMIDDQIAFNTIYDAAHRVMLMEDTGLFNWRVDNQGAITGSSSATDAELDIAAALIFAQRRVERGEWTQHPNRPYDERARSLLDSIWEHEVADGRYLKAGNVFGDGQDIINLSYFAPAWFRIYTQFEGSARWDALIEQGYQSLYATEGAPLGLAPDWSTADGQPAFDYCNTHERPRQQCRYEMTYDAIRVPWRVGLDCLWFKEQRACDWSQRSARFLASLPDQHFALMYNMQGAPVVDYQDEVMISMWLVGMVAAENQDLRTRLEQRLLQRGSGAVVNGYWGASPDAYYQQSLAWFAAALLAGDFRNLF